MIKNNLIEVLHEMEEVTKLFKLEPFDIYIIGGGACILGEYTTRATFFFFCLSCKIWKSIFIIKRL